MEREREGEGGFRPMLESAGAWAEEGVRLRHEDRAGVPLHRVGAGIAHGEKIAWLIENEPSVGFPMQRSA